MTFSRALLALALAGILAAPAHAADVVRGEALFRQFCASCHALQEDTIGPPLGGVTSALSNEKLIEFMLDPAAAIERGEPRAQFLFNRYKAIMPPTSYLSLPQMQDVLAYLAERTATLKLPPRELDLRSRFKMGDRVVAPVKPSGLVVELEDFLRVPVQAKHPPDKGIATLRAHPADPAALWISDQMGIVYRAAAGETAPFLNLAAAFENFIHEPGIGTGLGSFAFHPDFPANRIFYTTHTEKFTGLPAINDGAFPPAIQVPLQWVLTEWTVDDARAATFSGRSREVLRVNTPSTAHGFQDIGFSPVAKGDPDYGLLYIGCGDGGANNLKLPELCHHIRSLLGTVLRIDPRGTNGANGRYGIPADNPFAGDPDPTVRREIWAYGFRNPHRLAWDHAHGPRLIVADIGESNVEEINLVVRGGDYGWSRIEGRMGIDTKTDAKAVFRVPPEALAPYRAPFGEFDHRDGKAISGGFVYRGPIAELRDKYIFGDIVTGKLFYMNFGPKLDDPSIYELTVVRDGQKTSIGKLSRVTRVHLRLATDERNGDLFVMTKADGLVRRITKAYRETPVPAAVPTP